MAMRELLEKRQLLFFVPRSKKLEEGAGTASNNTAINHERMKNAAAISELLNGHCDKISWFLIYYNERNFWLRSLELCQVVQYDRTHIGRFERHA